MMTKPFTRAEAQKSVELILAFPPSNPKTIQEADAHLENIKLVRFWWEYFDTLLTNHAATCGRIIRGDDKPGMDANNQREIDKHIRQITSWGDGSHPWLLSQAAAIEEGDARRAAEQEQAGGLSRDAEKAEKRLEYIEPIRQRQQKR